MKDNIDSDEGTRRWKRRANIAFVGFLLIAGYFFVTEHRAHLAGVLPYLPFLLLLACPLMHIFMHGGHGHHDRGDADQLHARPPGPQDPPTPDPDRPPASLPHQHH